MKTLFTTLIGLISFSSLAQLEMYDWAYQYTSTAACTSINDDIYYTRNESVDFLEFYGEQSDIVRCDDQLRRLDSVNIRTLLGIPNTDYITPFGLDTENGNLVLFAYSFDRNYTCGSRKTWIVELNPQLNMLDSVSIQVPGMEMFVAGRIEWNGETFGYGILDWCSMSKNRAVLFSLDQPLDTSDFIQLPTFGSTNLCSDAQVLDNGELLVLVSHGSAGSEWHVLDSTARVIRSGIPAGAGVIGNWERFEQIHLIHRPASLPIAAGTGKFIIPGTQRKSYQNLLLGVVDTSNRLSYVDTFALGGVYADTLSINYTNTGAPFDMLDDSNLDSVRIVQSPISMNFLYYASEHANPIFIYNYNVNTGQMNWTKKLVSGYPQGYRLAVAALSRGRTLVGINEYNHDRFGNNSLAIRWLILDSNGSISLDEYHLLSRKRLDLYPNPAAGSVKLSMEGDLPHQVQVYNSSGVLIFRAEEIQANIDLSELEPGIYYLNFSWKDGSAEAHRLIVAP